MPWKVELVKYPKPFTWQSDYFPRTFHYKKDALELKKEVEANGGEVRVTKVVVL